MIWSIHQQQGINSANQTADRAEKKTDGLEGDLRRISRHVDRLTLACQSMWELIRDNTDLTEEDLERKISEVDLRDGKADGKIAMQVLTCIACGQKTNSKRSICVMCGAPVKRTSQFEG